MNIYTNELTQNTKQGKSFNARINKVNDVVFYGETSQETTTGKNIIDMSTIDQTTRNGITCTYDKENQIITFDGTCTANNTTFGFSQINDIEAISNLTTLNVYWVDGSVEEYLTIRMFNSGFSKSLYINLTPIETQKIMTVSATSNFTIAYNGTSFRFDNGSVANNLKLKVMLANSKNTSYEQYTGGQPAPNPDYPMEVKTITGSNTISLNGTNYDLNLGTIELAKIRDYQDTLFKASGKQLFNPNFTTTTQSGITFTASDNYSVMVNGTASEIAGFTIALLNIEVGKTYTIGVNTRSKSGVNLLTQKYKDGTYVDTLKSFAYNENSFTFTVDSTFNQVRFRPTITSGTSVSKEAYYITLCEGSTALDYEPYGNYWYKKGEVGKIVLDGTQSGENRPGNNGSVMHCMTVDNVLHVYNIVGYILSDKFKPASVSELYNANKDGIAVGVSQGATNYYRDILIRTSKLDSYSYADFQTWLSNNNVIVYYALATLTYERITDEQLLTQLQAIENMSGNGALTSSIELKISYDENINYETNGEGFLTDILEAEVVEELNGDYYLDFSYKLDGALSEYLKEENVIKCKVANGSKQLFRIKRVVKDFDTIEVYAQHIFYDLLNNFLLDTAPTNLNGAAFGTWVLNHTNYPTNFTFLSDIVDVKSARYVRRNPVEAFIGDIDNSMVNLFGGDLERNNFTINLKSQMGVSDGIKLLFGKNIKDIKITSDYSSIITKILPLGFDGLMLPEVYVDSPLIGNYETPKIAKIEFSDIKYDPESEEEGVYTNIEDAYIALRNACNDLYSQGVDLPLINIKIDWVELSKTNEYRNYQALETLHLGDYITAEILGLNYKTRVIKINYNPLTDMVENFEIGSIQSNIGTSINANTKRVESINISSILQSAQDNATTQITTAMGGYVYKTHNELYIMDTDDTSTAQKVWRWNLNGLGYSENGINGPYNLAMTQDGQIVANFITTGTMDVSRIAGLEQVVITVDTIKNDYFDSDGNALSVKTSKGFTFDSDGLNISDSETGFNTTIDETGTFYKEGNTILSQTTKDNTITKDLVLYGKYYYGVNENLDVENFTKDDAMFVGQLYADNNNEEGFGHFYNGQ